MVGPANVGGSRILLRKLREIMETGGAAQERLDRLVHMVASTMVADVCSIYLTRGAVHELFATEGLKPEAVHRTRLKHGEGLVGLVAETAQPLNIADAPHHERFSYRPETGEDPYNAFLGVPIVRSLKISSDSTGNRVLSAAINEAADNITAGESLATPLGASGHFPPNVVEMVAVAEQSNTLETVLTNIADSLEKETWRRLDLFVRLLEPVLLLVLASAVLVIVVALMLPMLKSAMAM